MTTGPYDRPQALRGRVAASCSAGLALAIVLSACSSQATADPATQLQAHYEATVDKVAPSVVTIDTEYGTGSGIVLDANGTILTNTHVVTELLPTKRVEAHRLTVSTHTGKTLAARLIGCFVRSDVAVISVAGGALTRATIGDSDRLRVGQIVMAMGSPLRLQGSVTVGIVSGLNRVQNELGDNQDPTAPLLPSLPGLVQSSADINPGNSGGALVDLDAKVVGMPTLAAINPNLGGAAAGIGFAIPINRAADYSRQIVESGRVTRSHLGILGLDYRRHTGKSFPDLPTDDLIIRDGIVVTALVTGAGAAQAGIQVGDQITAVGGRPTLDDIEYQDALAPHHPGETVVVAVRRPDGSSAKVTVTLSEYKDTQGCKATL